jgi:hypothetical protein
LQLSLDLIPSLALFCVAPLSWTVLRERKGSEEKDDRE